MIIGSVLFLVVCTGSYAIEESIADAAKRAPMGFQGMRGKKDLTPSSSEHDDEISSKEALMDLQVRSGERSVEVSAWRMLRCNSSPRYMQTHPEFLKGEELIFIIRRIMRRICTGRMRARPISRIICCTRSLRNGRRWDSTACGGKRIICCPTSRTRTSATTTRRGRLLRTRKGGIVCWRTSITSGRLWDFRAWEERSLWRRWACVGWTLFSYRERVSSDASVICTISFANPNAGFYTSFPREFAYEISYSFMISRGKSWMYETNLREERFAITFMALH